ncbi:hypothetical protein [Nocardia sp. NPDC051570]|uniref:hypothetical protein n=1 Tax=Nocardia sp. NPDC051570 TaxID=3364324 RepID=UPI0037B1DC7F
MITDDIINPVLRDWTGVANIMSLAGMTFGSLAAIPLLNVSSFITGRNFAPRIQIGTAVVIIVAMTGTFLNTPMAHTPTSYMSNQFPVTVPVMTYWLAYLGPPASMLLLGSTYIIRELLWVRRGPFARALAGIAVYEVIGLVYCAFKVYNLYLQHEHINNYWHRNALHISATLTLSMLAAAGVSAGIYASSIFKDRFHRYRLLRRFGDRWVEARAANPEVVLDKSYTFRPTRRACWAASRTEATAYRLQIELADHSHQVKGRSAVADPAIA